jgi:hypothetical protein
MIGPAKAVFLDIPSLIDSAWRRIEYSASAECNYQPGPEPGAEPGPAQAPPITLRPFWTKPPFLFFAITVFFVSYGPTWGGLCAIAPKAVTDVLRQALGVAVIIAALALAVFLYRKGSELIRRRFEDAAAHDDPMTPCRRHSVYIVAALGLLAVVGTGVWTGIYLYRPDTDSVCTVEHGNRLAVLRLAMCVVAILAFAAFTSFRWASVKVTVRVQAAIIALVALIQWIALSTSDTPEASGLPYRHLFLVWAPCIVAVVALAPSIAPWIFRVPNDVCQDFRQLLPGTELFVHRPPAPELTIRRIIYATVYGPAYHPLHLLLFPAFVALVAPAGWLYLFSFLAFVVSAMLLVWGNVSARWQQLNTYLERAFLSGTPLIISLFVIIVAVLRLAQFEYVSTLLDAMPFGTIFGLIVMNYVLFWLVEYWMNRVASAQLLGLIGQPTDEVRVDYRRDATNDTGVRVLRGRRFLVSHGSGRFLAVGTVRAPDPPPPDPPAPAPDLEPAPTVPAEPAFQAYYLSEVISLLGNHTRKNAARDHERAVDINQRAGLYFVLLNSGIFLVTAAFVGLYLQVQLGNNAVKPVVTVESAAPAELVDLPGMLQSKPGEPVRPAIVVVGSGGGTRAALYTASVLNGLHRMGLDGNIVLLSGVSGGGVALAYFAANSKALTAPATTGPRGLCPDSKAMKRSVEDEWDCFNKSVTKSFIGDVLNGATEWRVFRTTALSVLLAESFERHLMPGSPSLGSLGGPALILNTAITGHPDDESDALKRTIDKTRDCAEAERPFSMMHGGRLIFTNLQDIDAFPGRESPIPDVRLPYQIVRAAGVPLTSAAALNANFPPVFPNARVQDKTGQGCQARSFYVTDGGAEENLGLISALYALESALAKTPANAAVRPIHIVIAEASAVTYDYSQDRGLSTALSGSRDRLAGGLTDSQLDKMRLQSASGAKATIQFHYLGLPLAFRARGGFGTHWMYAKEFHLNDPRPRTAKSLNFVPVAGLSEKTAAIDRADLEALWLALHDPDKPFCEYDKLASSNARKVQGWICGSKQGDPDGRDLHMSNWKELVETLRPYRRP